MRIYLPGADIEIEIGAIHITDNYDSEYYIDDSTKAKSDKELVISRYDHERQEALYPVWMTFEEMQRFNLNIVL